MNAIDISVCEGDRFLSSNSAAEDHQDQSDSEHEHTLLIGHLSQIADSLVTSIDVEQGAQRELAGQAKSGKQLAATSHLLKLIKIQSQDHQWPQYTRSLLQDINARRQTGVGISVAVEIVDSRRITELNNTFRGKDTATNVLSFPASEDLDDDEMQSLAALMMEQGAPADKLEASDKSARVEFSNRSDSLNSGSIGMAYIPLGDIVLCRSVIEAEAKTQGKPFEAHWVHLATHGLLHLFGFSHHDEVSANCMESLEICLLQALGFNNPYIDA